MTETQRWTFTVPTALGDTQSCFEIGDDALKFESDDPMGGGSDTLRWDGIREGATAAMQGMGGRGAPQMARWIPTQLEWLIVSRTAGGGQPFMRVLPQGPDRDAIVAAVQARLQSRWIGERLPLVDAQRRLGVEQGGWSTLKVVGIVVAVMALLVVLLILLGLLLHPVITIPAGFALGAWLLRNGLAGLRDSNAVSNMPTAKAGSAAPGLVELEGRAVTAEPSAAGISGRPCVWWDVAVYLWYEDSEGDGEWKQVAARYGGNDEGVELEDDSGRLPIWLEGAQLVLQAHSWESGEDTLPAPGVALLDELGFPWSGGKQIRVVEQCVEVDEMLYVLGTLDERRNIPDPSATSGLARLQYLWRTGQWRRALVGAVPGPARIVVAVTISYLGMMTQLGRGGERVRRVDASRPPAIAPTALLVWKGAGGRPFLVANRPERDALDALRRRSLVGTGIAAAVLGYTLYDLVGILLGE